jgi:hypothetical protein
MPRVLSSFLILSWLLLLPVRAGHELPYYPAFYPQEIRLESVDPATAARRLQAHTLHAYLGGTPDFARQLPSHVTAVTSLKAYLVLTFDGEAARLWPRAQRCTAAQAMLTSLSQTAGAYVFHPYPVTPYHGDYLYHFDRLSAAQAETLDDSAAPLTPLHVRARGALALPLVQSQWPGGEEQWDVTLEEISLPELLASHASQVNGWLSPPWRKTGWWHAYLLLAPTVGDQTVREAVEVTYQRLVRGDYGSPAERLTGERDMVALLRHGCERVVVGYAVRQEYVDTDYSSGIENLAYDAHTGLNSAIFVRTVKLKDLPWNGWLRLGVSTPTTAAWNPIAGMTDASGQLLWSAVGDVAFFPSPYSEGWTANRIADYQSTLASQEGPPGPKSGHTDDPISTPTPRTVPVRLSRQRPVQAIGQP